jgi:hypothetical protein
MRNSFLLLLAVLYIAGRTPLFAQQKQLEQVIGWKGKHLELHTITNKAKQQSCTFVVGADSIRALVLNSRAQAVQQFNIPHVLEEQLLGGFFRDGRVYLFTESNGHAKLHNWVLDIATGTINHAALPFDLKKEKRVEVYSCGDRFVYFTVNSKTAEFIVYNFTSESNYSTIRYHFEEGIWEDLTREDGLSRKVSVKKVDQEGECSINVAIRQNKIYLNNDTLLLLMDNKRGLTTVFSFDLVHDKPGFRTLPHKGRTIDSIRPVSENTFLLRNKLYYVLATSDSLCIEVADFYTGEVLKTFAAGKDDSISFKNTPIIQEGSSNSKNDTRELDKTRQLLRKMMNGDAVLVASLNNNNQVEISVGSYTRVNAGLVAGGGYAGGALATTGAPAGVFIVPTGGFSRGTWTKSARFTMLLDAATFHHVEGNPANSINDRIASYTAGMKIAPDAENLFRLDNTYYYAYYHKDERTLVVLKF